MSPVELGSVQKQSVNKREGARTQFFVDLVAPSLPNH